MKNINKTWLAAAASIAAAAVLSACGGSSDTDPPVIVPPVVATEVPDSAGASAASFITFLLSLSMTDESSEPLTIKDTFSVPVDEANEPTVL